jgi:hypothetical protein
VSSEYHMDLNYEEAKKTIAESDLTQDSKDNYLIFLDKFPTLDFFSNSESSIAQIESENGIQFSENIRVFRKTLASVMYGKKVEFRFKSFLGETPRSDKLTKLWYSIGLNKFSFSGTNREILLKSDPELSLIPIANTNGQDNSSGYYLGINSVGEDSSIYEFSILDIFDSYNEGESISQSIYPVFDSYPQMLAHISEIKYLDGKKEVIVKARDA